MSAYRSAQGGRVERQTTIKFSFNGKRYSGVKGDTLASALLANGIHFVGRSYKYHRPRGIMSAGTEEASALVGIDRGQGRYDTNTRATTQELFEGLKAQSQHCWPSLTWDIGVLNRLGGRAMSTGFYYKTFMWPRSFWDRVYEPIIRKSAGLGKAPKAVDPDNYAARYAHCDVLIIGAGPAGLAAALAASKNGQKVILADEQSEFGGSLLADPSPPIDGEDAQAWLAATVLSLAASDNITTLTRTTAVGYYHQNFVGLVERLGDHAAAPDPDLPRQRMWRVRAARVILATGAIERPLVFGGNDLPGIMLAGAARTYLNRYGVKVGSRPVIVTSHDSAYLTAFDLADAGVKVGAIVDIRDELSPGLVEKAGQLGIEILSGHTLVESNGRLRVSSVAVVPVQGGGVVGPTRTIECDSVLMCGGWTPSIHLFSQSKGTMSWRDDIGAYVPGDYAQNACSVGACNGRYLLSEALNDGAAAGSDIAKTYTVADEPPVVGISLGELPTPGDSTHAKAFVDYQHDVTAKDIHQAVREGFHSIEHIKRYTTTGMATDQGKTSNLNGLAIASKALGRPIVEVGLTTFRPPYTPTSFGAFAGYSRGDLFDVTRKSPTDP
ncbi:MAG: 2Fe-2S iron-sulfur cluster-binding protein, partial [Alphaproteobacteria bacterium]